MPKSVCSASSASRPILYKRDRVAHGFFAPSNANPSNFAFPIGGSNQGTYDEFGLFGQFRF